MGQCTIRWSNGHCAWSILPVGEANGNFLVRGTVQGSYSNGNGFYPLEGAFWSIPRLAQRTRGSSPVRSTALLRVAVAGSRVVCRGAGQGPGALCQTDRQISSRLRSELFCEGRAWLLLRSSRGD